MKTRKKVHILEKPPPNGSFGVCYLTSGARVTAFARAATVFVSIFIIREKSLDLC